MKRKGLTGLKVLAGGMLIALVAAAGAWAEISVASYCELTIKGMEMQIPQTEEVIALVRAHGKDSAELERLLAEKRVVFDREKMRLYEEYGITDVDFVTYMNRNAKAVNAYLAANPGIAERIDALSAAIETLNRKEAGTYISPALGAPKITLTVSGETVTVSWDPVEGATGYLVHYTPHPYRPAERVETTDMKDRQSFSGVFWSGAAYLVGVQAYDGEGRGPYSNFEHFSIP